MNKPKAKPSSTASEYGMQGKPPAVMPKPGKPKLPAKKKKKC